MKFTSALFTVVAPFALSALAPSLSFAEMKQVVTQFEIQPHAETPVQSPSMRFSAEILTQKIKDQDVIRLSIKRDSKGSSKAPVMSSVDLARGAGLAPIAWTVSLPDGRSFNLTGAADAATIDFQFKALGKKNDSVFRDNLFFQSGVVAPLFPQTNRLTGQKNGDHSIKAVVLGQTVTMPLNNVAGIPNAVPHHLHGLLFGQLAKMPLNAKMIQVSETSASATGDFEVGAPWWTGKTSVETTSELTENGYVFHMKVKNIGTVPVPVGAGAHPYFSSPDMSRDSIRIHVPARKLVEIDNLSNVLPTGKISLLKDVDPALNFSDAKGTLLHEKAIVGNTTDSRLDNLWVDLEKDPQGFAYAEVFFPLSHLKVKMTALTKNVIGIQGYAPKFTQGKRPFVALELVTNLPDPRKDLWHDTDTGMKLLKPGETFEYGYKVEVSELK